VQNLIKKEWSARSAEFSQEILDVFTFLRSAGIPGKFAQLFAQQLVITYKFESVAQLQEASEKDPSEFKETLKSIGMSGKHIKSVWSGLSGSCTIS